MHNKIGPEPLGNSGRGLGKTPTRKASPMNQVSRTDAPDTPASRLRDAVEAAGYTITGLDDDATQAHVLAAAEGLVREIQHYRDTSTPAGAEVLTLLIGMGAELGPGDETLTVADARDAAMALGKRMAAKA